MQPRQKPDKLHCINENKVYVIIAPKAFEHL